MGDQSSPSTNNSPTLGLGIAGARIECQRLLRESLWRRPGHIHESERLQEDAIIPFTSRFSLCIF